MGVVYLARDEKFDADVALKVSLPGEAVGVTYRQRFKREAKIGNLLGKRAGFVRALDWGDHDGHLYLAMDLVQGARELDLRAGSQADRLALLARLASLVSTAHDAGVIHRDLKPGNVLVAADGGLALADFGLAKVIGEDRSNELTQSEFGSYVDAQITQTGIGMGTPLFMAPEQFEDAQGVSPSADVYSLGVLLFYVLTGRLPYAGGTPAQIRAEHAKVIYQVTPPPTPRSVAPSVPTGLNLLCSRSLEMDPAKRPSAQGFAEAIQSELELLAKPARAPADLPEPLGQEQSPERVLVENLGQEEGHNLPSVLIVLAAAVLGLSAVGTVFTMISSRRQRDRRQVELKEEAERLRAEEGRVLEDKRQAERAHSERDRRQGLAAKRANQALEQERRGVAGRRAELEIQSKQIEKDRRRLDTALRGANSARDEAEDSAKRQAEKLRATELERLRTAAVRAETEAAAARRAAAAEAQAEAAAEAQAARSARALAEARRKAEANEPIPCVHAVHRHDLKHPNKPKHNFDFQHDFDRPHQFDPRHAFDRQHAADAVHVSDPMHSFDLLHSFDRPHINHRTPFGTTPCTCTVACTHRVACSHPTACRHSQPCRHKVACTHPVACSHQSACVHKTPCKHKLRCKHRIPCVHRKHRFDRRGDQ
jgi:hypothetical protein